MTTDHTSQLCISLSGSDVVKKKSRFSVNKQIWKSTHFNQISKATENRSEKN